MDQRPPLHEQYADESRINPDRVNRTAVEAYEDILPGADSAAEPGLALAWIAGYALSEHSAISAPQPAVAISARTRRVAVVAGWPGNVNVSGLTSRCP